MEKIVQYKKKPRFVIRTAAFEDMSIGIISWMLSQLFFSPLRKPHRTSQGYR